MHFIQQPFSFPSLSLLLSITICLIISCSSKDKREDNDQTIADKTVSADSTIDKPLSEETKKIFLTTSAKSISNNSTNKKSGSNRYRLHALGRIIVLTSGGKLLIDAMEGGNVEIILYQDDDTTAILKTVEYATYQNDLILIYQLNENGKGKSEVARINLDVRKVIWKTPFGGINLSPAIIQGNFLYGTTLGYIGKIDLNIGGIVWEKQNLWEQVQVNSFYKIGISEDTAIFIGKVYARVDNNKMTTKNIVLRYNKYTGDEF